LALVGTALAPPVMVTFLISASPVKPKRLMSPSPLKVPSPFWVKVESTISIALRPKAPLPIPTPFALLWLKSEFSITR
jgi:hypothetical protein